LRTFKKVAKLNEKLEVENGCCNEALIVELKSLQANLTLLNQLEIGLASVKSISDERFPPLVSLAVQLNVSDTPPVQVIRGEKKPKGKSPPPRKPFHVYKSVDNIQIRVGREAADNDQLSCNPIYRDDNEWWMV
jgi:hypothetical protein